MLFSGSCEGRWCHQNKAHRPSAIPPFHRHNDYVRVMLPAVTGNYPGVSCLKSRKLTQTSRPPKLLFLIITTKNYMPLYLLYQLLLIFTKLPYVIKIFKYTDTLIYYPKLIDCLTRQDYL
jgi:hypothetical protein